MDMTLSSCRAFVSALASSAPAPGGGGAAALVGAIGIALGNMAGSLTVGKQKYAAVEQELLALMEKCGALQEALLNQVEADETGFLPLARAYSIPKDDPNRAAIVQKATVTACEAPMRVLELCAQALDQIAVFAEKCSRLTVSDAGCAAVLCKAAMQAAALNVYTNTKMMTDRSCAEALNRRTQALLERCCPLADGIFASVLSALGQ